MRYVIMLIAVVLIASMLVGPSLISGINDFAETLNQWVKYGFEDLENGIAQNGKLNETEGEVSMGVTVQFKDGTQQTIEPDGLSFTLFPMTVYFEEKEVSKIKFDCMMLVDWSGELNSLTINGFMLIAGESESPEEVDTVLKRIGINEVYGPEIPRNEWFHVDSITMEADDIEFLGDGDWFLRGYTKLDVQAEFPQTLDTRTASAKAEVPISIQHGILTAFSVEIEQQVFEPFKP